VQKLIETSVNRFHARDLRQKEQPDQGYFFAQKAMAFKKKI